MITPTFLHSLSSGPCFSTGCESKFLPSHRNQKTFYCKLNRVNALLGHLSQSPRSSLWIYLWTSSEILLLRRCFFQFHETFLKICLNPVIWINTGYSLSQLSNYCQMITVDLEAVYCLINMEYTRISSLDELNFCFFIAVGSYAIYHLKTGTNLSSEK